MTWVVKVSPQHSKDTMNQLTLRQATEDDLEFMARIDLKDEGIPSKSAKALTEESLKKQCQKLASFTKGHTDIAWVYEHPDESQPIALIMCRFRDMHLEDMTDEANAHLFKYIDANHFPEDGRFTEIFQLWVHPKYRRLGLATQLKRQVEHTSRQRAITMIYTHTEETNQHVIDLNLKLNYKEIRRGTLGNDIVRISLIKNL